MRAASVLSAPERAVFVGDGYLVLHRPLSADLIADLLDALEADEAQSQDLPLALGRRAPDRFRRLS